MIIIRRGVHARTVKQRPKYADRDTSGAGQARSMARLAQTGDSRFLSATWGYSLPHWFGFEAFGTSYPERLF